MVFTQEDKNLCLHKNWQMDISECSVVSNSSVTPWTTSHQAPLSMGFSRQEYWSRLPFPSLRGLPDPGIKPMSSASPALAGRFLTTKPSRKPTWIFMAALFTNVKSLKQSTCHWVVVQSLNHVQFFGTRWTGARQASLSITISWRLLRLMSIELVMPSDHLILCHPLLLLHSIFPASGPFLMNWLFPSGGQSIEFQLQHQSFQ